MKLDVVVPTYNRADLLELTLKSLCNTRVPTGLAVQILVVDNNSTDATPDVVRRLQCVYGSRLVYLHEPIQGRAAALNCAITRSSADLIGMIDDDEQIDENWYEVAFGLFTRRPDLAFVGGPYLPAREIEIPSWLPVPRYRGVIGWLDSGCREFEYTSMGPILPGGNAIVRRQLYDRVGLYNPDLGRTKGRLMGLEDQDIFQRFLDAGAPGIYSPSLIIYHYIPQTRFSKSYHRRWAFWNGVSLGMQDRTRPAKVARVAGFPRYRIRLAIAGVVDALRGRTGQRQAGISFAGELDVYLFFGLLVGIYLWRR